MDRLDLLAVQGTLKSLLQYHSSKASILRPSAFFTVHGKTTGKTIALTRRTFVGKVISLLLNMLSRLVINCLKVSKYTSSYGGKIHIFRFDVCESTIRCHQTHSRHRVAVTTDQSRLHHLPQKPPPASSPAPAQETSTPSSLGRRRLEAHRAGGDRVPASCVRLVSQQASSTWNAVLACPSI